MLYFLSAYGYICIRVFSLALAAINFYFLTSLSCFHLMLLRQKQKEAKMQLVFPVTKQTANLPFGPKIWR